ncbi:MAG: response regulator [Candidatus Aureabacteria bacterium]|nr:response regulator [Candidatus Auribacterota bacterium]
MAKILIIDDGKTIVRIISNMLKVSGYEVVSAFDGQSGVLTARKENPDLIILDLNLPIMNGFMVCRILKFDEKFKHIPIIMCTARKSDADKVQSSEVGANAYLTKPFEKEELLAAIEKLLI